MNKGALAGTISGTADVRSLAEKKELADRP